MTTAKHRATYDTDHPTIEKFVMYVMYVWPEVNNEKNNIARADRSSGAFSLSWHLELPLENVVMPDCEPEEEEAGQQRGNLQDVDNMC